MFISLYINLRALLDSKLKTKLTAENEMKYKVKILRVLQCGDSSEFTVRSGLWLSVLLGMWNIAGYVLGSYTD
jgi:hypothetical protein